VIGVASGSPPGHRGVPPIGRTIPTWISPLTHTRISIRFTVMEVTAMSTGKAILASIRQQWNLDEYQKTHQEVTFEEYLEIVREHPEVTRTAYQRLYDMIISHGTDEVYENKEKIIRYKFFTEFASRVGDAIFGLDRPLMQLVNAFKSAAKGYGTERRVLLLHGPVGSSKSTIARLLKRGLEDYSRTDKGMIFAYSWKMPDGAWQKCPMHEDPLHLVPRDLRPVLLSRLNENRKHGECEVTIRGEMCPFCRQMFNERLARYDGDWNRMIDDIKVYRLTLSEQDRIGVGTFQPKDEKNQDSTELTGDINYRKIAEYGTDSDPRAFNFDGELNIANRGLVEFIEVLKLDVAFLYDLLGASQEHKIKPKKFAQTDIDEVILGHSVSGETPIAFRHEGKPGWSTLQRLHERFADDPTDLEVLAHDFETGKTAWTPVRGLVRHPFTGKLLTTSQKWGVVETTPNHSIYDRTGQTFYPEQRREVMAVRGLCDVFALEGVEVLDVLEGIEGFVRDAVRVTATGGKMTRPCRDGWARLDLPRHATAIRAVYDPIVDVQPLKDLVTVLVWYATEGHVNGRNGGVVISQANRDELERVRAAYARITTGKGSIDAGAKTDSAWRLYLGAMAIVRLCKHHCGELSVNKRLPDFLFHLPTAYLQHAFDELMRTDGTRKLTTLLEETASDDYREKFFDYKTISPMLAAQVGTLASLLGYDYSVYRLEREGREPAYRVRFVSGTGKRGGRRTTFEARLHERTVENEWMYDIECAGLHNFVCGVGNVVAHNTNEPEYRRLQNNEFMEALRDRTVKIDIPYVTRLRDEIKIYEKDFNPERVKGKHIAPHTVEIAAMWAVLTRLVTPKHANLTLLQKLKLYNGKTLPGFTEDNVVELKREAVNEGMTGISPRYIQDKISNAIVAHPDEDSVNPFMVLHELEAGLRHHSLITSQEQLQHYKELLAVVKEEYEDIVKNEVQRAIAADEDALARLCANYIDNVRAYTQREKVRNRYTGNYDDPDERLMRSVEEKIDIPEGRKDDFRREIMNYIGALALDGKKFDYKTNERLQKALELKLFEDQKDTIKLTSLVSNVVDKATQEKIDIVKQRLIRNYGYNESSATDVLTFVASIFARGHTKK
jgi:serine protein kinase